MVECYLFSTYYSKNKTVMGTFVSSDSSASINTLPSHISAHKNLVHMCCNQADKGAVLLVAHLNKDVLVSFLSQGDEYEMVYLEDYRCTLDTEWFYKLRLFVCLRYWIEDTTSIRPLNRSSEPFLPKNNSRTRTIPIHFEELQAD